MKYFAAILLVVLAGCAASPERLDAVAAKESARMAKTSRPLSTFARYELRAMTMSSEVTQDERKVAQAKVLEQRLRDQLLPLIQKWESAPAGGRSGTLVIEPRLESLRIVSGGARFWAGALAGSSTIDLDLMLTEKQSSSVVAKPRVDIRSNAIAGGWSVGATDRNLLDYIAVTAERYLKDNY